MALDEATKTYLAAVADSGAQPLVKLTPAEARELGRRARARIPPGPAMELIEDVAVPTTDGENIRLRVLMPSSSPSGVIVYLHGGGWMMGGVDESDTLARHLASRTGCTVVVADYRLAPEHPFPAAVDDAYEALEWAAGREWSTGRSPIIVCGDSTGGNLAAAVALRSRDRHGPKIALQVLIYPVTDAGFETPSYVDAQNQLMLTREAMMRFWDLYAPDVASRLMPDAAPLRAESLAGLPPALVITAEHDVLRDEGERYARRLSEAGVTVDYRCLSGQMHGFLPLIGILPGSETAQQLITDVIRDAVVQGNVRTTRNWPPQ